MITRLYIRNFALIDHLDIELGRGFSVITGETGAGKSIILGAIALLLGQRADSKSLKQGADKGVVEAHFDLSRYDLEPFFLENDIEYDASDTIIRRELNSQGKSRAFINDSPVQLALLKDLGERLVDVHSQHQNLLLARQDFQLSVVDIIAGNAKALDAYQKAYNDYAQAQDALQQAEKDIEENRRNADFIAFQLGELSDARLVEGEQEELEQESHTLTHSEDIKAALFNADQMLSSDERGAVGNLRSAAQALSGIERVYPSAGELAQRLNEAYIEIKDIADDVAASLDNIDFDPARLEQINNRLDRIYELQKKYHTENTAQLIALQQKLAAQLSSIEDGDAQLAEMRRQVEASRQCCQEQADKLTAIRSKAAKKIEKEVMQRLIPLGMPYVRVAISIAPQPLGRSGQDKVSFLFSANTGTPLMPVAQVASGGETARVMLVVKAMISGAVRLPTIIFDEIDAGVSGKVAEQMAQIMADMGSHERQVISITHLPQIAAMGSTHYKVSKHETPQGTVSEMQQLDDEGRLLEIAQMLSGADVTDAAIANARGLLHRKE